MARIDETTWWLLTGKGNLPAEIALYRSIAPTDGSVRYRDLSEQTIAIGLWGPNSRAVLESVTSDDVSNETFPWYSWQKIDVGMAPVTALRISYLGELGWELYVPPSLALHVWDTLWEAGRAFDMPAIGAQAVFSTRIEKGYRLWGSDLTPDHSPKESGVTWAMDMTKDFRGKKAAIEADVNQKVVTLRFDDPLAVVYGWEPVYQGDRVIGRVAGGAYGYSVGAFIAHAFLDAQVTDVGLAVEVEQTGRRLAAHVVQGPLFDPSSIRLKA